MAQEIFTKCLIVGIIMFIMVTLGNLIRQINSYDNYIQASSSHVVSAFDG